MVVKDTVLFLVLFHIHMKFCVTFWIKDEPTDCDRYTDILMRDWSCRPHDLYNIPENVTEDNVVTRAELLSLVGARCSNEALRTEYDECMTDLAVECPARYIDVMDSMREKWDMFCDGKKVSMWLKSVMEGGYSFNLDCSEVSREAMEDCSKELGINEKSVGSNTSFATASVIFPAIISDMFHCTARKLAVIPGPNHECGSSWQDILLDIWLMLSFEGGTFAILSYEDRQELLAIRRAEI